MTTSSVILTATPCQVVCARILAAGRRKHKESRRACNDQGSPERNLEGDFRGVLAELTIYDALERLGARPEYVLLDQYAVRGPDMKLGKWRIEIKTGSPGKFFAGVNKSQYDDPDKRPDFYLFALYQDATRFLLSAPIPPEIVGRWKVFQGHSAFYSERRENLPLLVSLEALIEQATEVKPAGSADATKEVVNSNPFGDTPSCVYPGCDKPARFPYPPKRPQYCVCHFYTWRRESERAASLRSPCR
ncbi:MAG TPA: hypothetical protein VKU00_08115 [Chthonomonadaceae bacterium]|nr:hypothetical protein [Chthonomonadaceae bacterium]